MGPVAPALNARNVTAGGALCAPPAARVLRALPHPDENHAVADRYDVADETLLMKALYDVHPDFVGLTVWCGDPELDCGLASVEGAVAAILDAAKWLVPQPPCRIHRRSHAAHAVIGPAQAAYRASEDT